MFQRLFFLCVLLAVIGCAPTPTAPQPANDDLLPGPPNVAGGLPGDQTRSEPAEDQAEHCILGKADHPATVAFLFLGPNDLTGELRKLTRNIHVPPDAEVANLDVLAFQRSEQIVRVVYREETSPGETKRRDVLVWFGDGKCGIYDNYYGDSWLDVYRKRFAADAKPNP